jgi:hypothetical protein
MIEGMLKERRSLEKALADLRAHYQRDPAPALARTIELLREEIEFREHLRTRSARPIPASPEQVNREAA